MFNIIKLNEKDNIGIASMDIPENVDTNLNFKSKDCFKCLKFSTNRTNSSEIYMLPHWV